MADDSNGGNATVRDDLILWYMERREENKIENNTDRPLSEEQILAMKNGPSDILIEQQFGSYAGFIDAAEREYSSMNEPTRVVHATGAAVQTEEPDFRDDIDEEGQSIIESLVPSAKGSTVDWDETDSDIFSRISAAVDDGPARSGKTQPMTLVPDLVPEEEREARSAEVRARGGKVLGDDDDDVDDAGGKTEKKQITLPMGSANIRAAMEAATGGMSRELEEEQVRTGDQTVESLAPIMEEDASPTGRTMKGTGFKVPTPDEFEEKHSRTGSGTIEGMPVAEADSEFVSSDHLAAMTQGIDDRAEDDKLTLLVDYSDEEPTVEYSEKDDDPDFPTVETGRDNLADDDLQTLDHLTEDIDREVARIGSAEEPVSVEPLDGEDDSIFDDQEYVPEASKPLRVSIGEQLAAKNGEENGRVLYAGEDDADGRGAGTEAVPREPKKPSSSIEVDESQIPDARHYAKPADAEAACGDDGKPMTREDVRRAVDTSHVGVPDKELGETRYRSGSGEVKEDYKEDNSDDDKSAAGAAAGLGLTGLVSKLFRRDKAGRISRQKKALAEQKAEAESYEGGDGLSRRAKIGIGATIGCAVLAGVIGLYAHLSRPDQPDMPPQQHAAFVADAGVDAVHDTGDDSGVRDGGRLAALVRDGGRPEVPGRPPALGPGPGPDEDDDEQDGDRMYSDDSSSDSVSPALSERYCDLSLPMRLGSTAFVDHSASRAALEDYVRSIVSDRSAVDEEGNINIYVTGSASIEWGGNRVNDDQEENVDLAQDRAGRVKRMVEWIAHRLGYTNVVVHESDIGETEAYGGGGVNAADRQVTVSRTPLGDRTTDDEEISDRVEDLGSNAPTVCESSGGESAGAEIDGAEQGSLGPDLMRDGPEAGHENLPEKGRPVASFCFDDDSGSPDGPGHDKHVDLYRDLAEKARQINREYKLCRFGKAYDKAEFADRFRDKYGFSCTIDIASDIYTELVMNGGDATCIDLGELDQRLLEAEENDFEEISAGDIVGYEDDSGEWVTVLEEADVERLSDVESQALDMLGTMDYSLRSRLMHMHEYFNGTDYARDEFERCAAVYGLEGWTPELVSAAYEHLTSGGSVVVGEHDAGEHPFDSRENPYDFDIDVTEPISESEFERERDNAYAGRCTLERLAIEMGDYDRDAGLQADPEYEARETLARLDARMEGEEEPEVTVLGSADDIGSAFDEMWAELGYDLLEDGNIDRAA